MNTGALTGLAWLLVFQSIGEVLSRFFHLPIPGPVIGMVLLFAALFQPRVRDKVALCAQFLLAHLSLLFVPVGVGVMAYFGALAEHGLRLVLVIILSTWIGLAVTASVLYALRGKGTAPSVPIDPKSTATSDRA
ncbi:CidA/LrgA family protein [Hylemonella gracilis]|jgi:holin-like protein|uniref:CidA/LrgA family protein n=1 Tax=Hylemonella gracilis TaxID=80880 RepID=A0A4P6UI07_9BURK|nr:CidA/LrgA family protein [Hylemonella gracilis]QBK03677.1 CidA/LrgA family protein [Hylemonella gracilis]